MNPEQPINNPREAVEVRITAYLLGELPPEEEAEIRESISRDPELKALHDRLSVAVAMVGEATKTSLAGDTTGKEALRLSDERREKLLAQFKTIPIPVPKPRPWRERAAGWLVPLAAAAVLVVLAAALLLPAFSPAKSRSMSLAALHRTTSMPSEAAPAPQTEVSLGVPVQGPQQGRAEQRGRGEVEVGQLYLRRYGLSPQQSDSESQLGVAAANGPRANFANNSATAPSTPAAPMQNVQVVLPAKDDMPPQTVSPSSRPEDRMRRLDDLSTDIKLPEQEVVRSVTVQDNSAASGIPLGSVEARRSGGIADAYFSIEPGTRRAATESNDKEAAKAAEVPLQLNLPSPAFKGAPVNRGTVQAGRASTAAILPSGLAGGGIGGGGASGAVGGAVAPSSGQAPPFYEGGAYGQFTGQPSAPPAAQPSSAPVAGITRGSAAAETHSRLDFRSADAPALMTSRADAIALGAEAKQGAVRPLTEEIQQQAEVTQLREGVARVGTDANDKKVETLGRSVRGFSDESSAPARPEALGQKLEKAQAREELRAKFVTNHSAGDSLGLAEVERRQDLDLNSLKEWGFANRERFAKEKLGYAWFDHDNNDFFGKGSTDRPEASTTVPILGDLPVVGKLFALPETQTRENAISTFSLNVTDVSFKNALASLNQGVLPSKESIRAEEFVNAFNYRDPEPAPGAPLAFAHEIARYPYAHNRDLLRLAVKTASQGRPANQALNLVLLLDNSGSMERADRVRILREATRTLGTQLQPADNLSIVTFSRTATLRYEGLSGEAARQALSSVNDLNPQGGTNLEDALKTAYDVALRHFIANGINRVVLLTDGAANLGNVQPAELQKMVEGRRKQGVALDCFGIGWEGYNDQMLEMLSRHGDGRYGFVNSPEEAGANFAGQLAGALQVAASDVKVQVEFNPARVTSYRQVGYEKHQLTQEQFRDNTVDAAELGAAESGNALYVIQTNLEGTGPVATVRARYKVPGTAFYHEHEWVVPYTGASPALEQSSPAMRLAATAAGFAEWLGQSPHAAEVTPDALMRQMQGVPEAFGNDQRPVQLREMIQNAKSLAGQ